MEHCYYLIKPVQLNMNRGTIFIYPALQYISVPVNRYSPTSKDTHDIFG
jgi:hypothetical protein